VTFWLNMWTQSSQVTIGGGAPANSVRGNSATENLYTAYPYWWSVTLGAVTYGGSSIRSTTNNLAIVDTGTSLLYMLESDYINFANKITQASSDFICLDGNGVCYSMNQVCENYWPSMQDLSITLG
jgi:hypothetical protein